LKPSIDFAPVNSVRPKITVSFNPLDRGYQILAIPDDGTVAARIQERSVARKFDRRRDAKSDRAGVAERDGIMRRLLEAGATLLPSSCGACAGYGNAIPDGSTVISTTARNFQGRMGSATARVFLASPYTVAASALKGYISDARDVLT